MTLDVVFILYLASGAVGLLLLYVVVRLAVGGALRSHEVWLRDGSLDRALDARAAALAEQGDRAAQERAQIQSERG